jgi:hypothetical protein
MKAEKNKTFNSGSPPPGYNERACAKRFSFLTPPLAIGESEKHVAAHTQSLTPQKTEEGRVMARVILDH